MAGDALSGFVFVDNQLVGDLWGEALLMESAGKFFRPSRQFPQVHCLNYGAFFVIIFVAVVLHPPL